MVFTDEMRRKGHEARRRNKEAREREASVVSQRTHASQARWAAEKGSEDDIRHYFKREVSIEEGLALLARMRENCKIASYELNDRITADNNKDRCQFCGGPKKNRRQWALVRPFRDPATQLVRNDYFCSIECVALQNRRDQGVYGVPDRGMMQGDNPRNHPREFTEDEAKTIEAAQEKGAKNGAE
jgi:hypothetical protein